VSGFGCSSPLSRGMPGIMPDLRESRRDAPQLKKSKDCQGNVVPHFARNPTRRYWHTDPCRNVDATFELQFDSYHFGLSLEIPVIRPRFTCTISARYDGTNANAYVLRLQLANSEVLCKSFTPDNIDGHEFSGMFTPNPQHDTLLSHDS
jgi:hypothetical protein